MPSKAKDPAGREADRPTEIPGRGWKAVLLRTKDQVKEDNTSILAAGVAFYLMLALAPAIAAMLAIYGLVADPTTAARHVDKLGGGALPADARRLVSDLLTTSASRSNGALGIGLVVGLVAAILGASKGARSLIETVNVAFDERESRGFVRLRLLALVYTVGAMVVMLGALAAMTVLPAVGDRFGSAGRLVASVVRWPVLALVMIGALAVLYRYGPDRDNPRWRWVSPGALVATLVWLAGSALFTVYADHFGSFGKTYGTLGAVVVLMLWLFLTAYAVLLGAEINAEVERQTRRDSTEGPEQPLGRRRAYAADTVGADPASDGQVDEVSASDSGVPGPR